VVLKSHGFHYLPIYCQHLKIGKINGNAEPTLDKVSSSALKVNADNGFAHSAINLGLVSLFQMASDQGISCLSIYNSYNCGVLGFHTKRIAEKGFHRIRDLQTAPASIAPIGGYKSCYRNKSLFPFQCHSMDTLLLLLISQLV
jgi:(2R)-3-sulfolactate dehydrogenase (NADP+)